jgi:hypothetical protein
MNTNEETVKGESFFSGWVIRRKRDGKFFVSSAYWAQLYHAYLFIEEPVKRLGCENIYVIRTTRIEPQSERGKP